MQNHPPPKASPGDFIQSHLSLPGLGSRAAQSLMQREAGAVMQSHFLYFFFLTWFSLTPQAEAAVGLRPAKDSRSLTG